MKEIRKLQVTAGGTYILTLPREWVESMGLSRGSPVSLGFENNEISLIPAGSRIQQEARSINVKSFADRKLLELSITASYIQGQDVTQITSAGDEPHEWKAWSRDALKGLVGVEILEEYSDRILLQNLIDPYKFDLVRLMEKFSRNSSAVLMDAISSLVSGNRDLASDAFERGTELIRNYRLLMRLAILSSREKELRRQYEIDSLSRVIVNVIAIREMGRIAYYAMRTAQHVMEFSEKLDPAIAEQLVRMERETTEMTRRSFLSLIERNLKVASQVIDRMSAVRELYEKIHESDQFMKSGNRLPLSLIIRDIRAVAGYAVALADDAVLGVFA